MQDKRQDGPLEKQTDEALMERYKMGDQRAFEILYSRHSGKILGYLIKKLRSDKEAQDVLQDSFLKLHRSRHLYNPGFLFVPWLFTVTRSVMFDHIAKQNRETKVLESAFENQRTDFTTGSSSNLSLNPSPTLSPTLNREALDGLPANQRQAVSLRVYSEATFEQIAERLSTSPENARQLVSRGIRKLKETLDRGKR